jgi:exosortase/archaeosortase family protein
MMLIVWQQRSFLSGVLTLALVPLWAWLGNLLRIFAIAMMLDRFGIDWTHGWPHTVLGLAVFAGSFACMLFAQSAITLVLAPFPVETATTSIVHGWYDRCVSWPGPPSTVWEAPKPNQQAVASQNSGRWRIAYTTVLCSICLMLGGISALPIMGVGPWRSRIEMLPSWTQQQVSNLFVATDLPQDFSGFKLGGFAVTHRETGSVFGEHSATWVFQHMGQPIQVSVDFPFDGLHELESCYVAAGKQVNLPIVTTTETIEDFSAQVYEVNLIDDLKQTSFLWYLSYDADGMPVTKLNSALWGGALAVPPVAFQVQILVSDCGELTEQQRTVYRNALMNAARELLPKIQMLPTLR